MELRRSGEDTNVYAKRVFAVRRRVGDYPVHVWIKG
jgi:hypothetical protein